MIIELMHTDVLGIFKTVCIVYVIWLEIVFALKTLFHGMLCLLILICEKLVVVVFNWKGNYDLFGYTESRLLVLRWSVIMEKVIWINDVCRIMEKILSNTLALFSDSFNVSNISNSEDKICFHLMLHNILIVEEEITPIY